MNSEDSIDAVKTVCVALVLCVALICLSVIVVMWNNSPAHQCAQMAPSAQTDCLTLVNVS